MGEILVVLVFDTAGPEEQELEGKQKEIEALAEELILEIELITNQELLGEFKLKRANPVSCKWLPLI
jgi:hypothetical protein